MFLEGAQAEAGKRTHRKTWSLYVGTAILCARVLKATMKRLKINWKKKLRRRSYV